MVNTGVFNTTFNPAELNKRSFNATILRKFPAGAAPLFGLTSQTKRTRAVSSTHGYFSKTFSFTQVTLTAAALVGDIVLTVASTVGIVPDMIFHVPGTREIVRVTAVTNATTLAVSRAAGRIVAAAIPNAAILSCIGTSHAEASLRPTARSIPTVYVPNFTQIFRNAWAVSGTAKASLVEAGEGNIAESKRDGALFHATDIETAAFLGQAKMDVTGPQPVHLTQGTIDAVYQYAPAANVVALGVTTNQTQLETALIPGFSVNTDLGNAGERIGFVDSKALQVLNQIGRLNGVVELISEQTTFGLRFSTFKFFKGIIRLIEHPMFNDSPAFTGTMVTIDLPAIQLAYMGGRDAVREEYDLSGKQTNNGQDAAGGTLTSELAVETINPQACQIITGFTAGAAG